MPVDPAGFGQRVELFPGINEVQTKTVRLGGHGSYILKRKRKQTAGAQNRPLAAARI
eukprot:SAG11_NODE_9145_length_938_cov_1.785459_1_plen_57_part_00